jgi:hypothetical protein
LSHFIKGHLYLGNEPGQSFVIDCFPGLTPEFLPFSLFLIGLMLKIGTGSGAINSFLTKLATAQLAELGAQSRAVSFSLSPVAMMTESHGELFLA